MSARPLAAILSALACSLIVVPFVEAAEEAEGPPSVAEVRRAAERALPFLEEAGLAWIKARNCSSCHTFTFNLWAHREAQLRGLSVDAAKIAEWVKFVKEENGRRQDSWKLTEATLKTLPDRGVPAPVRDKLAGLKDKSFETEAALVAEVAPLLTEEEAAQHKAAILGAALQRGDGGGLDNMHQLLVGGASRLGGARDAEWEQSIAVTLAKLQDPGGSWQAAGQLARTTEQHDITSGWSALALAAVEQPTDEVQARLAAALERRKKVEPGKNLESLVVRMLCEQKFGAAEKAGQLRGELLTLQNADGGWGRTAGAVSDAFSTGQALYGLSFFGPGDAAAIGKAQRYLVSTQTDAGSWDVPPERITHSTGEGRLKRLVPIYRYWGSAWATIGLLRTLPAAPPSAPAG